jgi:hypothetical protein
MLNWRRDPGYEKSIVLHEQRMQQYEQRRIQHELRMKRLVRETEQLRKETEQLRQQNARGRQLLASIDALCFPPASSLIQAIATEPGSKPSSP